MVPPTARKHASGSRFALASPAALKYSSRSNPAHWGNAISIPRLTVALFALAGGSAAIACEYPPLVTIPEGREATREEMLEAQTEVRNYVTAMEAYLACVDEELTVAGDDAPEVFKAIMFSRHNTAWAELEAIAAHFNEQLQLYRCTTGMGTGTSAESSEATDECVEILAG